MSDQEKPSKVSRRSFLSHSAMSAAAMTAAATTVTSTAAAQTSTPDANTAPKNSIGINEQFTKSVNEAPVQFEFGPNGLTGSQVFARVCKSEGLAALFCCPGNYTMINAISATGIPAYGGRIEDIMCAAADGFSRVTGEVVATSGTEGPGFTNMIMSIASAQRAHTPLLVLASNMAMSNEDRLGGIQQMYQQPTTEGIRKYGKRITIPNRIHEYAQTAFRELKTGVPGVVHLDFPSEVHGARFKDASELKDYWEVSKYRSDCVANPSTKDIAKAVDLIKKAERPMIVAGQGVFQHKAWEALKRAAEKNDIAVVESGPVRGHFGDEHRLSANMSPESLGSVDLVIFIGQYLMPNVGEYRFNPDVKAIRIHPVAEDLGRNWPLELGLVSDEKAALEALADALPKRQRATWVAELAAGRKKFEEQNDEYFALGMKYSQQTNVVHPAVIGKLLADFLYKGNIPKEQTTFAQGGWTGASWTRRWLRAYRPGQMNNCPYQYYPIGPDVGHLLGAGAAMQLGVGPQKAYQGAPVFGFTGDAGIAYSVMEFDTLTKYKIPAIMTVYNNNAWGMITAAQGPRSHHMYMFQDNLRYDRIAEGLGARGEYVTTPEQYTAALARAYQAASREKISTLINVQATREFLSTQSFPPGTPRNLEPGITAYMH